MGKKASILVIVFLILAIIVSIAGIIFLNQSEKNKASSPYPQADNSGVLDDSNKILSTNVKLNSTTIKDSIVTASVVFDVKGKSDEKEITLFNKNIYDSFFLISPPSGSSDQEKSLIFKDPSAIASETNKLKGKQIRLDFDVKSNKCNKSLTAYLNGDLESLKCSPIPFQVTANAK